MGKPYDLEMQQMDDTYRWAMQAPVDRLAASLRSASILPLLAVGSGGSFTTADFAAALHRSFGRKLACAMTPMEAALPSLDLRTMAVFLATAGGKNPDVLGAFRGLVLREPRRFIVLCTSVASPLARLAAKYCFVDFVEADLPSGKDGFLATNSLLVSTVILVRAYSEAFDSTCPLPPDIATLLGTDCLKTLLAELDRNCRPLWQRETVVVLHGPTIRSAAVDLESKFTEAALGNVRTADYRHFAHGRHHWLAKHPEKSAILAFVTPEDKEIASKTLDLIPTDIPVVKVDVPFAGIAAGVAALAQVLHIVGSAGRARGFNPGKPRVPSFGRRIYHLKVSAPTPALKVRMSPQEVAAVERKTGKDIDTLERLGQLQTWRDAYALFTRRLMKTSFQAVVLDYDGTLCGEAERCKGLSATIGRELLRLLKAGATLGFATGRGKSVKQALRDCIPNKYRSQVVIGYYNGGDIGQLDDDGHPDGSERVVAALRPIVDTIQGHSLLSQFVELEPRLPQIKVVLKRGAPTELTWALLQQLVYKLAVPGVAVVGSSHSMDVLAPGVSKRAVVDSVGKLVGCSQDSILCIGDRGQWPGNDFCLLAAPHSLSVDEVSPDPATCWNLASAGQRGTQAAVEYLKRLKPGSRGLRLTLEARSRRQV